MIEWIEQNEETPPEFDADYSKAVTVHLGGNLLYLYKNKKGDVKVIRSKRYKGKTPPMLLSTLFKIKVKIILFIQSNKQ